MEAYLKVEREIWQEEQQAPAPALTHAVATLEKISSELEKLTIDITQNQNFTYNQVLTKVDTIDSEYVGGLSLCSIYLSLKKKGIVNSKRSEFVQLLSAGYGQRVLLSHLKYLIPRFINFSKHAN